MNVGFVKHIIAALGFLMCCAIASSAYAKIGWEEKEYKKILNVRLDIRSHHPYYGGVEVKKDGTMVFCKMPCRQTKKYGVERLGSSKFGELENIIVSDEFWNLKSRYIDKKFPDEILYTITVKYTSKRWDASAKDVKFKYVSCKGFNCPLVFEYVLQKMESFLGENAHSIGLF